MMELYELDTNAQLDFIALNQNLEASKEYVNASGSYFKSNFEEYVKLVNDSFVAPNQNNQPVIVSDYSIGNENIHKEFDNYKAYLEHLSEFAARENKDLSSAEPEWAFKRPEVFLKDDLHKKLYNESHVDSSKIKTNIEKHEHGFELFSLEQNLDLVHNFVKEQQKIDGIDPGHAEIILQSKVDINENNIPVIVVDSSYNGKEIKGEFHTLEDFGQSVLEEYQKANEDFVYTHPLKGENQHWDKVIDKIEQGIRREKAEQQRDNHVVYGVNDHWNALIEKISMSKNEVNVVADQKQEPTKQQEQEVLNGIVGDATERAETIMNAQHHEQQKALSELSVPLLKQYEGKTLSSKDIEKIANEFQKKMAGSLEKYSDQKANGVSWTDRVSNLKSGVAEAIQGVKDRTLSSLQSIKAIPENTKDFVRQKMLEVVVKTNSKIQHELSRAEEKLSAPEKASETFSKSTDGKYTEKANANVFSLKGVKSIEQKINNQIKQQEKSLNKGNEQQNKTER